MSSPRMDDERFGELLLHMSEVDKRRLLQPAVAGSAASVAVWMAEELRRQSQELHLSESMTHRMRDAARSLQSAGAEARRKRQGGRRCDYDLRPANGSNGQANGHANGHHNGLSHGHAN